MQSHLLLSAALCVVGFLSGVNGCFSPAAEQLLRDRNDFALKHASEECVQQFANLTGGGAVIFTSVRDDNATSPLVEVCSNGTLLGRRFCAMQCAMCSQAERGMWLTEVHCDAQIDEARLRCTCFFGDEACPTPSTSLVEVAGDYKKECVAESSEQLDQDDIEQLLGSKHTLAQMQAQAASRRGNDTKGGADDE